MRVCDEDIGRTVRHSYKRALDSCQFASLGIEELLQVPTSALARYNTCAAVSAAHGVCCGLGRTVC